MLAFSSATVFATGFVVCVALAVMFSDPSTAAVAELLPASGVFCTVASNAWPVVAVVEVMVFVAVPALAVAFSAALVAAVVLFTTPVIFETFAVVFDVAFSVLLTLRFNCAFARFAANIAAVTDISFIPLFFIPNNLVNKMFTAFRLGRK